MIKQKPCCGDDYEKDTNPVGPDRNLRGQVRAAGEFPLDLKRQRTAKIAGEISRSRTLSNLESKAPEVFLAVTSVPHSSWSMGRPGGDGAELSRYTQRVASFNFFDSPEPYVPNSKGVADLELVFSQLSARENIKSKNDAYGDASCKNRLPIGAYRTVNGSLQHGRKTDESREDGNHNARCGSIFHSQILTRKEAIRG